MSYYYYIMTHGTDGKRKGQITYKYYNLWLVMAQTATCNDLPAGAQICNNNGMKWNVDDDGEWPARETY